MSGERRLRKKGSFLLVRSFVAALTAYVTVKVVDELVDDTSYVSLRAPFILDTKKQGSPCSACLTCDVA